MATAYLNRCESHKSRRQIHWLKQETEGSWRFSGKFTRSQPSRIPRYLCYAYATAATSFCFFWTWLRCDWGRCHRPRTWFGEALVNRCELIPAAPQHQPHGTTVSQDLAGSRPTFFLNNLLYRSIQIYTDLGKKKHLQHSATLEILAATPSESINPAPEANLGHKCHKNKPVEIEDLRFESIWPHFDWKWWEMMEIWWDVSEMWWCQQIKCGCMLEDACGTSWRLVVHHGMSPGDCTHPPTKTCPKTTGYHRAPGSVQAVSSQRIAVDSSTINVSTGNQGLTSLRESSRTFVNVQDDFMKHGQFTSHRIWLLAPGPRRAAKDIAWAETCCQKSNVENRRKPAWQILAAWKPYHRHPMSSQSSLLGIWRAKREIKKWRPCRDCAFALTNLWGSWGKTYKKLMSFFIFSEARTGACYTNCTAGIWGRSEGQPRTLWICDQRGTARRMHPMQPMHPEWALRAQPAPTKETISSTEVLALPNLPGQVRAGQARQLKQHLTIWGWNLMKHH